MSKHTPGPWAIVTDSAGQPMHIVGETYTKICSFLISVKRNCVKDEIVSNARLIAAAPDLLSHLQFAVKVLSGIPAIGAAAQVDAMRAAIDKATGGQSHES